MFPFCCYVFFGFIFFLFLQSIILFYLYYNTFFCLKGVSLLLKNANIPQPNLVRLPSHLVTSENCQCHRSFHLFCTDLFPEYDQDIDMIYIHPAPRIYERDSSRRTLTPYKKSHHHHHHHQSSHFHHVDDRDNEQDIIGTARSEPVQTNITENQLFEKKVYCLRD